MAATVRASVADVCGAAGATAYAAKVEVATTKSAGM